jgi:transcriptional regulator with XRE-family HTH domain
MGIKELRQLGGWSVEDVARIVGRCAGTIYRWEDGTRTMPALYPTILGILLLHYRVRSLGGLAVGLDSDGLIPPRGVRRAIAAIGRLEWAVKKPRKPVTDYGFRYPPSDGLR